MTPTGASGADTAPLMMIQRIETPSEITALRGKEKRLMKSGMELREIAEEIDAQNALKRDLVVPTSALTMHAPSTLPEWETAGPVLSVEIDGSPAHYEPNRFTHRQIADRIGIPAKYYDRMMDGSEADVRLLTDNVNHWLHSQPENRMLRTFDHPEHHGLGTARAFLSDRYKPLDNQQVAEAVLPVLSDHDLTIASADITEKKMYIKAYDPTMKRVIRRGDGLGYGQGFDFRGGQKEDVVHWGVAISNSEVGSGSLKVESFLFRSYCDNGLIFEQISRRHHVGRVLGAGDDDTARAWYADDTVKADDEAFFLKVRDTVEGTLADTTFEAAVDKLSESTGRKIEGDVQRAVDVTAKHLTLTDGEKGGVLRHLIEGGDLTAWGMLNAVTRTAEDSDSYDRATELEAAGMKVVNMTPDQWKAVATA
jgi:hypothetical protein